MNNRKGKLYKRRTARHEAGHAVLCVILGYDIRFATVNSFDSKREPLGQVAYIESVPTSICQCNVQNKKFIELRVIGNLSGVVAEYMHLAKRCLQHDLEELIESDLYDIRGPNTDLSKILKDLKQLTDSKFFKDKDKEFRRQYIEFLIRKCIFIMRQPPISKAMAAITELLMEKPIIYGDYIYKSCFEVKGFKEVCMAIRQEYLGIEVTQFTEKLTNYVYL